MSFNLQIHPPLERVFHLIPENAVMSGDDIVPGVLEPQPDGNSSFMFYQKVLKELSVCHGLHLDYFFKFFVEFVLCVNLLHPQPSLFLYGLLLPVCTFFYL